MSHSVLILKSGRCEYGKCIFCGYGKALGYNPTVGNVNRQFKNFFDNLRGEEVKVFSSGSFLDEKQVPAESRRYFIQLCREKGVKGITIESRPEYITESKLKEFEDFRLIVAIGLEVADDSVLDMIEKEFHLKDFEKAAGIIKGTGALVRTYLLVNLPFVDVDNVKKSLDDSVEYALNYSDSIVLINLLPHRGASLFELWLNGEWNFLDRKQFDKVVKKWKTNPKVELDFETFKFVPRFPPKLKKKLVGVGEEFLTHRYFEVWQDYLQRWYNPPGGKRILLFLPCSYKRPYSMSKTHRILDGVLSGLGIYRKIHCVVISNAGVIPREFEDSYPFNDYDWDERLETGEIKSRYIDVASERIKRYLKAHGDNYEEIYCFLKYNSESYLALKKACDEINLGFENLLSEKTWCEIVDSKRPLLTRDALADLAGSLS